MHFQSSKLVRRANGYTRTDGKFERKGLEMADFSSMFATDTVAAEQEPETTEMPPIQEEETKPKQQRRKRKPTTLKRTVKAPVLPNLSSLPAILACLYTPKEGEQDTLTSLAAKAKENGAAVILSPDEPNQVAGIVLSYDAYTNLALQATENKNE